MASIVITVLGDDRAGLVDEVASVVAAHDGNWEQSHMTELAGKFAGVVLVGAPDTKLEALLDALSALGSRSGLMIQAEPTGDSADGDPGEGAAQALVELHLTGQDHPGIVAQVSRKLAAIGVSIDELETEVGPAPQAGSMFTARAILELAVGQTLDDVQIALEDLSPDLMVDLEVL